MQIAILYNTFSANGSGKKIAKEIKEYCSTNNIPFSLYENDWPEDVTSATCIALVGGDGTMNYFLNRFPKINTPIILFPGGTGNDFYWKLYNTNSISEQLKILSLAANKEARTKLIDIAECVLDNKETKYYVNGVGLGFDGAVLQSMNAIRFFGGFLGYYLVVLKTIFMFKEPYYQIQINNDFWLATQPFTIINIANSSRTGGGFMISPHAEVDDGKLNLLYCNVSSIWKRLTLFLKVGNGKHINNKAVTYQEIDKVTIKSNDKIKAQLDGELVEASLFFIHMAYWKLNFVSKT